MSEENEEVLASSSEGEESTLSRSTDDPFKGSYEYSDTSSDGTYTITTTSSDNSSSEIDPENAKFYIDKSTGNKIGFNAHSKLGTGSFGDVMLGSAYDTDRSFSVAIKTPSASEGKSRDALSHEIEIHSQIDNENIIRFLGTSPDKSTLAMELANGGTLYDKIFCSRVEITMKDAVLFSLQTAKGVEYLHKLYITHNDLKLTNILLDKQFNVKIADFGCATFADREDMDKFLFKFGGENKILAPELLKRKSYVTEKTDIFSLAYVLWQLISKSELYPQFKDNMFDQIVEHVATESNRPKIPEGINPDQWGILTGVPYQYDNLISLMWSANPNERPTADETVETLDDLYKTYSTKTKQPNLAIIRV